MLEELEYVIGINRSKDLERKIKAKYNCLKRYNHYIENEISVEYIAPIR